MESKIASLVDVTAHTHGMQINRGVSCLFSEDLLTNQRLSRRSHSLNFIGRSLSCPLVMKAAGKWQMALDCLRSMKDAGIRASPIVYSTAIGACLDACKLSQAVEVQRRRSLLPARSCFFYSSVDNVFVVGSERAVLKPLRRSIP